MRVSTLVGIVLIVAGVVIFARGGSFTSHREVFDVGGMRMTAEEQQPIRPWAAGLAVIAGAAIVIAGARRKA